MCASHSVSYLTCSARSGTLTLDGTGSCSKAAPCASLLSRHHACCSWSLPWRPSSTPLQTAACINESTACRQGAIRSGGRHALCKGWHQLNAIGGVAGRLRPSRLDRTGWLLFPQPVSWAALLLACQACAATGAAGAGLPRRLWGLQTRAQCSAAQRSRAHHSPAWHGTHATPQAHVEDRADGGVGAAGHLVLHGLPVARNGAALRGGRGGSARLCRRRRAVQSQNVRNPIPPTTNHAPQLTPASQVKSMALCSGPWSSSQSIWRGQVAGGVVWLRRAAGSAAAVCGRCGPCCSRPPAQCPLVSNLAALHKLAIQVALQGQESMGTRLQVADQRRFPPGLACAWWQAPPATAAAAAPPAAHLELVRLRGAVGADLRVEAGGHCQEPEWQAQGLRAPPQPSNDVRGTQFRCCPTAEVETVGGEQGAHTAGAARRRSWRPRS